MDFEHEALALTDNFPLVYTATSKHYFYFRAYISKYVTEQKAIPLNPFMIYDYFLLDTVDRDLIREGNNNLVRKCDEIWVFGPISDGVLVEILIAKEREKPLRYFRIEKSKDIIEIMPEDAIMEDDVKEFRDKIL